MITKFDQKVALEATLLLQSEGGAHPFNKSRVFAENIIKDVFAMTDSPLNVRQALSEKRFQAIFDEIHKMEVFSVEEL
jgi:selenophosphate synthase